jgi:putative FmdB family regulatory protein
MPIYEYECSACAHHFDTIQKFSDEPLKDCPNCQQSSLQKVISSSSFQLKGTGWYETDFKTKPKTEPSAQNSDSSTS